MAKCKTCGHDNDDRGKYCGVCGTNLHTKGFNPENHKLNSYTKSFEEISPHKGTRQEMGDYLSATKAIAPPKKTGKKWSF